MEGLVLKLKLQYFGRYMRKVDSFEGSGWGTHVYLWQIHFDIWQNQYNIVKFKNKKKKIEKKIVVSALASFLPKKSQG